VEDFMHPVLVAALAEDRHWRCLCGAITQQPYRLCRSCRCGHRLELHDHVATPTRRSPLNARHIPKALPLARVLSLLQNVGKETQG
jgi:hypothetical protein